MGRPTKLDDLTAKRIVDALGAGMSRRGAAHAAGIGWSTLKVWLASGRRGHEPFAAFLARVEQAEGKAERVVVDALVEAIRERKVDAIKFWLTSRRAADWQKPDAENDSDDDVGDSSIDADESFTRSVLAAIQSRKVGT